MNVENILRVADAIEQHSIADLGFSMHAWCDYAVTKHADQYGEGCGTAACIAGWAVAVKRGEIARRVDFETEAGDFLGLGTNDRTDLFLCYPGNPTPSKAVAVLRHLAATGEVDWDINEKAGAE